MHFDVIYLHKHLPETQSLYFCSASSRRGVRQHGIVSVGSTIFRLSDHNEAVSSTASQYYPYVPLLSITAAALPLVVKMITMSVGCNMVSWLYFD